MLIMPPQTGCSAPSVARRAAEIFRLVALLASPGLASRRVGHVLEAVYWLRKVSLTVPVGPLRRLPMMISATPCPAILL
jgi:hypothetical protein